jgi:Protein phosphatase 2C
MAWEGVLQTTPKDLADDNQDAAEIFPNCIALADGASSGFDSGRWARRLVLEAPSMLAAILESPLRTARRWGSQGMPVLGESKSADSLTALRKRLIEVQRQHEAEAVVQSRPFVQEAQARGASSTLSVAWIEPGTDRLSLFALGDSCWMVIDHDQLVYSFPHEAAIEFPDQPRLIYSTPERLGQHSRFVSVAKAAFAARHRQYWRTELLGTIAFDSTRHRLLGCTDALAQWILTERATDRRDRLAALLATLDVAHDSTSTSPRGRGSARLEKKRLQKMRVPHAPPPANPPPSRFALLIEAERLAGRMRRDDSTAVLAQWRRGKGA